MKKNYFAMGLLFLALAFVAMDANAQRTVQVAPGIGTLNTAINSDTTATGERVDPNTVYVLQRGDQAYYGLTGSISNSGFPLTIVAEDGDGARPFLQPRDEGDGSSRAFRPRGDIKLVGLHVTNMDQLGGLLDRILRCSEDGIRVELDDCWFDHDSQSLIRVDNPDMTFIITNCVVSNIGEPKSPDNGRGIDDRGNDIDTIIIENSTFFNLTSRVIRDDGGIIKFARLDNNTFSNIGQMGITFGPIDSVVMRNNLMINAGFIPKDDDKGWIVLSADSIGGAAPKVLMTNNSAYMDTTKMSMYLNDTITVTPFMNATLMRALEGNNNPNFNLNVAFTDGPPFNDSMLIYMFDPTLDVANTPGWVVPALPVDGNGLYHLDVYYDFGYVNSKAKVAGMGGTQLGDPRWMADRDVFAKVDFEDESDRGLWNQFANGGDAYENMMVVDNPDMSGINTSGRVMMFTALAAGDAWAGAWSDANGTMTFTEEMHHMTMMVWKDKISNCGLKVEVGGTTTELQVANTVTNAWELITFDFSANIGETLTRLVFFPDFEARNADNTAYVDNIEMIVSPVEPVDVTFNVDMTGMISNSIFDPAVDHVDLAGSMNNWGDPVQNATDADADGIYTIVAAAQEVGAALEYKFRVNGQWDPISEFPGGGANRMYTVIEGENVVNVVFNDGDYTPWITGMESEKASQLYIYPNPATDQLVVRYEGISSITIMDVLGKQVRSIQYQGEDQTTLSVEDLQDGIYFITVGTAQDNVTSKFLKK